MCICVHEYVFAVSVKERYCNMTAKNIDEVRLQKPVRTKQRLPRAHIYFLIHTYTQTHKQTHRHAHKHIKCKGKTL